MQAQSIWQFVSKSFFLVCLLLCPQLWAADFFVACRKQQSSVLEIEEELKSTIAKIDNSFQYRDVHFEIESLKKGLAELAMRNQVSLAVTYQKYLGDRNLDTIGKISRRAEVNRLLEVAEQDSKFGQGQDALLKAREIASEFGEDIQTFTNSTRVAKINDEATKTNPNEAQTCKQNYDYSEKLGEVRDQGSVGWCGFFTLADLLSYKAGKRVSPADLALEHFNSQKKIGVKEWSNFYIGNNLNLQNIWHATFGAVLAKAQFSVTKLDPNIEGNTNTGMLSLQNPFQTAKQQGVCLEADFRSEDDYYTDLACMLKELSILQLRLKENGPQRDCELMRGLQILFPKTTDQDLYAAIKEESLTKALSRLKVKSCAEQGLSKNELQNYKLQEVAGIKGPRGMIEDSIDVQLAKGNIVAANLSARFIKYDKFGKNNEGYDHYVSIIGRRWNEKNKSCEYLLRNSWGNDFTGAKAGWEPDPQHPGHAWVSKAALARNLNGVSYLE